MKRMIACLMLLLGSIATYGQSYNDEKVEFTNYIKRMYEQEPFEGFRILTDYSATYMIVVIGLDKGSYPESSLYRIASVKAMNEAQRYVNGALIKSEFIYEKKQIKKGQKIEYQETIIENIYENSMGYIKSLEVLSAFDSDDKNMKIFIFSRKLNM